MFEYNIFNKEKIEILLIILTIHNTIHTTNSILNTHIMLVAQLREAVKNSNQENKRKLRDELYIKYFEIYGTEAENIYELHQWVRDDVARALLCPSAKTDIRKLRNIINTIVGENATMSTDDLCTALDRIYDPYVRYVK